MKDLSYYKYHPEGVNVSPIESKKSRECELQNLKRGRETDEDGVTPLKQSRKWPGPLPPILEPKLKVVFVGFNPGTESARTGHYYAHPSNRFWKYMFWSKVTKKLHTPFEDRSMPELYRIGFTDLVARSTRGITQLSQQEMHEGVQSLDDRIAEVSPDSVCFVGKGIWEAASKIYKWDKKQFRYGLDTNHRFGHNKSKLFCLPSTSGLNSISTEKQLAAWHELEDELTCSSLEQH